MKFTIYIPMYFVKFDKIFFINIESENIFLWTSTENYLVINFKDVKT